jgi:glycosyltransferase involved in cell wall biosynthesis
MLISVVAPCYNEEDVLDIFFRQLCPVLELVTDAWEIVCVNDGSSDNTALIITSYARSDPRIKLLNLSRNFGKERALTAGLDYSIGDVVIPIDVDLQDPPELIPEMVRLWTEGFDVVNAVRSSRKEDTLLKRFSAKLFYKAIGRVSDVEIPPNVGDFRLLSRPVVNEIKRLREYRRFMKGIFAWVGFKVASIPYERPRRAAGHTKFNFFKLTNFAIEGIASFSATPLRIASYIGMLLSLCSIIYAIFMIVKTILFGNPVSGYPSLIVSILLVGGIQMLFIGILGEYVGRIYDEVKSRPLYIIKSKVGFD